MRVELFMDNFNKCLLIVYLIVFFSVIYFMIFPPNPVFEHTFVPLEFSDFNSSITLTQKTDQYGNLLSDSYHYHVYADLNDNYTWENQTVHIKAYDSNWNYLGNISKNVSLSSLDFGGDGSDRNFEYNYFSSEFVDYKYVVFEIYDNSTKLCYNKTVEFDLDNIEHKSRIDYYSGLVW